MENLTFLCVTVRGLNITSNSGSNRENVFGRYTFTVTNSSQNQLLCVSKHHSGNVVLGIEVHQHNLVNYSPKRDIAWFLIMFDPLPHARVVRNRSIFTG